jgi:hypothetical protein
MQESIERFRDNSRRAADDPDLVPKLHALFHSHAGDNLDQIVKGVDHFYLCRFLTCLYVGPSTHWIVSKSGGQFRCPDCGQQYRPWRSIGGSDSYIAAQKIMVFDHCQDSDYDFTPAAVIQEFGGPQRNREVQMVLTMWPDTDVTNLINNFKAPPMASSFDHWCNCLLKIIFVRCCCSGDHRWLAGRVDKQDIPGA